MYSDPPTATFSDVFKRERFVYLCVLLAVGCALAALAGWIFDVPILRSAVAGFPHMKPVTAVAFLVTSAGLFSAVKKPGLKGVPVAAGCFISLTAAFILIAYLTGTSSGADRFLLPDGGRSEVVPATRMSPHSAINFVLLGLSLAFLKRGRIFSSLSAAAAVISLIITYAAVIGHLYGAERLYGFSSVNGMALPTIFVFVTMGAGLIAANSSCRIADLLASNSQGGHAVRRLLPVVLIVPTLAGWLWQFGLEGGYYGAGFSLAMSIFSLVVVTVAIVYYYSQTVHKADEQRLRAEAELADKENRYRELFDYSQGLISIHDLEGRLITVNRAAQTLLGYTHEEMAGTNMRALLRVENWPLFDGYLRQVTNEGLANGLLELITKTGEPVVVRYHNVLVAEPGKDQYILGHAQDVSELLAAQAELRNLSLTDDLTGLHNRRGFLTLAEQQLKLERHGRTARGLTLMFADLDGLKQINDQYGHEAGSDAIITFARLVKSVVRDADLLARWGGDEFVLLSIGSHDEHAEQVIDRIQGRIAEHNSTSEKPYDIACSIGVAPLRVDDGRSIEQLIAEADEAMYAEKKKRKSERNSLEDPLPNLPLPPVASDNITFLDQDRLR